MTRTAVRADRGQDSRGIRGAVLLLSVDLSGAISARRADGAGHGVGEALPGERSPDGPWCLRPRYWPCLRHVPPWEYRTLWLIVSWSAVRASTTSRMSRSTCRVTR